MKQKNSIILWSMLAICLLLTFPTESFGALFKTKSREVKITWDDTQDDGKDKYKIIVKKKEKWENVNPSTFKLRERDSVVVYLTWDFSEYNKYEIKYEVKDPKTDETLSGAIKKLLGADADKKILESRDFVTESIPILKKLKPGGTLSITFTLANEKVKKVNGGGNDGASKEDDGDNDDEDNGDEKTKEAENEGSDDGGGGKQSDKKVIEVEVDIKGKPNYFTSTGFIFSNENRRELAIIKTASMVEYEKDGKTMEGYEQKLVYKDDSNKFKAKPSAVQLLHYKLGGPIYLALGTPLNEKIFNEAFLGLSYLVDFNGGGIVLNLGTHYHKEIKISESSGFIENQIFPPSNELTLDDIHATEEYKWGFYFGVSFRL